MTSQDSSGTVKVTMTSQDSSGTARVTVRSWDALSRGVLGLRHYIPGYSPRTVKVTMTSKIVLGLLELL